MNTNPCQKVYTLQETWAKAAAIVLLLDVVVVVVVAVMFEWG